MQQLLDAPSSWAVVYPSAQLGNRFHAIAGAYTWARGLKLAVVWPPDSALLGTHQGCESPGAEIAHAAQHVRVDCHDVFEAQPDLTVPRTVPSDLAERLGLKRSESCAAGDTAPPCVFHVGLWHGAVRHMKGVRRVPPLPARASADAQKQACRAMLGRLRAREWLQRLVDRAVLPTCFGVHLRGADVPGWTASVAADGDLGDRKSRAVDCTPPELLAAELGAMPPTERPPCIYVAARCPSLLARFRDALREATVPLPPPRILDASDVVANASDTPLVGAARRAVVDFWALASVRTLLRYPYTSYSQVALSLHRRPTATDVMNVTPPACAARLHTASRRDFTPARIVGTGGCRADPASATGARLACSEAVDEVCADVSELM